MTLTNTTDKALEKVQPFLAVASAENVEGPLLELETEYYDAKAVRWTTFRETTPDELFGSLAIGPRTTVTLKLRTRVVKNAEPGAGYALAAADYRNSDGSCGSAKETWHDFTMLPAGKTSMPSPAPAPAAPAAQAASAATLPTCRDLDTAYGEYHPNIFAGRVFGIPKSIPLGTRWTTYTATLTNASPKELKSFRLGAVLESYLYNEGERDLSPYGDLQYWDTSRRAWKTLRRAGGNAGGSVPAATTLKPRESVHVQLRFRVGEDLPRGQAYDASTGITGTFTDRYRGMNCTSDGLAIGYFYPRR
ncbi:hypothetical protein OG730_05325 [Streptomyces sp. NBC_01298]|uniref:hypothetical protein n=1 Tax=Streptomyces sp. NBC_01298 TaxID=2903817 RepID=UPI002E13DA88|nr:hypothetical protein OG730_05325 [Streptomyces sp. NBC_01298]